MTVPSVFLSHNSNDKPFVRRLAKRLANKNVVVWLDEAKIQIGDSLVNQISEAILEVDFVIVVISRNSVSSPWVQKEISLAMSKELDARSVSVLPIRLDESAIPAALSDKLYANFRDLDQFNEQFGRLLDAMGVPHRKRGRDRGLSIEWTPEGPRLTGHRATISPTEATVLLNRWFDLFDEILPREKARQGDENPDAWGAARVRATLKACEETYLRTVYEEDLLDLASELGRKANLFYIFMENMHFEMQKKHLESSARE